MAKPRLTMANKTKGYPRPQTCEWVQDDEGNWDTECDNKHVLIEGTPKDNQYRFCPYCGKVIMQTTRGPR